MSQNRDHMSAIGREGGESRAASYAKTEGPRKGYGEEESDDDESVEK